jgi:hypothetical protein
MLLLQVQSKEHGTRSGQRRGLQQLRESVHHIRGLRLQQRRKCLSLRQCCGSWVLLLLPPAAACRRCGDGGLAAEATEGDAACVTRTPRTGGWHTCGRGEGSTAAALAWARKAAPNVKGRVPV